MDNTSRQSEGEAQSEVDNLYTDIDGIHHSYPVEYEVPEVEQASEPPTNNDVSTIPSELAAVDAGQASPIDPTPPGTIITREQLLVIYPYLTAQNVTDGASGKNKTMAKKIADLGYEVITGKKGKNNYYTYRKLP